MKFPFFVFMAGLLMLASCAKEEKNNIIDSCSKGSETFSSTSGITLNVTKQDWYLTRFNVNGGCINVGLAGTTNGDSLTILTRGDGLLSDYKIPLNSKKQFNQDISISFTATSVPEGSFKAPTQLLVYRGNDTLRVALESCSLSYE